MWGISFSVAKTALVEVGPHWLLCLRFGVAAALLALVFPGALRRGGRAALRGGAVVGGILYAAFALQTVGLTRTTPSKSAFLTGLSVLLVPLLGLLLFRTRVPPAAGAGVLLAVAGIALLTHPGSLAELNRGDLLTLACAVGFAAHILALSRFAVRVPWRELGALQLAFAFAASLPAALLLEAPPRSAPLPAWAAVLFLGVFCSAFAFLAQTWAQRHTSTIRVALILALEPVFAAAFSVLVLGERLTAGEWTGGALVVTGVVVAEVAGRREATAPAPAVLEGNPGCGQDRH